MTDTPDPGPADYVYDCTVSARVYWMVDGYEHLFADEDAAVEFAAARIADGSLDGPR